ncbi:RagB/SusD family nutrient uptake outer membrane protein [Flavobacterium psychrotrophum]|uniref:RagB/SusD family nutrient uptake outer membrane protein n=1 Tax=Flavobacterium psychrotrophum TaxID=2294119 RepID=UPI000E3175DC|nr:RagB/SusD family nutrient uptake outer membrane protein [Flavobacterium psychrotrophum]
MKTKFSILVTVLTASYLFLACEAFVETKVPESQLTGNQVFQNTATAEAALSDIYARMREAGFASGNQNSATLLIGAYADDLTFYGTNTNIQQFSNHTLLPSNTLLAGLWNNAYAQVYAANAILEGVTASESIPAADKERLTGEALFIRAYLHFYLVSLFGDVPYVTVTDYNQNSTITKMASLQVWSAIINDLLQAEALLSDDYPTGERIRASKPVVQALLARVYLFNSNWTEAEAYSNAVINNTAFTLETDLNLLFLKNSSSTIWALHPGVSGANTNDAKTFYFTSGPPPKSSLSAGLYDAFEIGDLRKELWVKTVSNANGTWYMSYKYRQQAATASSMEYTIIFRLEEQYLIRSEARAHLGNLQGSQQDLDNIRVRAGLLPTTASDQNTLLEAILKERRFEFFTEQGLRWLDLKRTGTATSVLAPIKPNWQAYQILLPLPEKELLLNPYLLPQNAGY